MYKNVIFDLGGVVVEWKPKEYLMNCFMDKKTEDLVYKITFGSEEWKQLDQGNITRAIANEKMLANAKKAGCLFEVQEVLGNWITILNKRPRFFTLVNLLQKAGYRTYYLSNMAGDVFSQLNDKNMLPTFDGGVASFEVALVKPDPSIYQALLDKYQLSASECIFIDDVAENVQAACNLGVTGIVMKNSINSLIRNLRSCGVLLC